MRAKKSLGQNFLKSGQAIKEMIEASDVSKKDLVLEIGPGKGVLTEAILNQGAKVFAIEADMNLVELLSQKFSNDISENHLSLIHGDILDFDVESLKTNFKKYKLVANIPYYITGAIIRKFLESNFQPSSMTLLVQKEVAERIVAKDGKESILSISVKAFGEPKIISKVSKRYFTPQPKVDSAIIHIGNINKNYFTHLETSEFFKVVKAGFSHKRKLLINNLESLGIDKNKITKTFEELGIKTKIRAEEVTLSTWLSLSQILL